eukprot:12410324-Karenia_brevis.AAC.1
MGKKRVRTAPSLWEQEAQKRESEMTNQMNSELAKLIMARIKAPTRKMKDLLKRLGEAAEKGDDHEQGE